MKHKYKLRMTVDGVQHEADINFNSVLDNVFNKRKRRIRDYSSNVYPSNSNTLSGYLTYGVGITNDANVPIIPQDTTFTWKGYRDTDYTNLSGTIGKVHLMCERIVRENQNFYDVSDLTLFKSDLVGSPLSTDFGEDGYAAIALDEDGETLICISNFNNTDKKDIKAARIILNDTRWGLEGPEGLGAYERGEAFGDDFRTNGSAYISGSLINHDYTNNSEARDALFDVDRQTESQTYGQQEISYETWNCFLYCKNDINNESYGTSITQDEEYIYMFEYFLGAVIRMGEYNDPDFPYSQYPFKPENCDYYYNITTRQVEGLESVEFKPLVNYAVIRKSDMSVIQQNTVFLTNRYYIDFTGKNIAIAKNTTQKKIDDFIFSTAEIINNKYPFRMTAVCADGDYVYLMSGFDYNRTDLWCLNSSNILGNSLPSTLTIENVSTANIESFCHTINRRNLFKVPSVDSGYTLGGTYHLVNKSTGIVNWIGFIDWLVSADADFGGVSVSAGQTVRFELIEKIENEG